MGESSNSQSRSARIEARLRERLAATRVEVIDESHLHRGHAGAASGGGHFRVVVVSPRFSGRDRIADQRLVYGALADMMGSEIHALSVRALLPDRV